MTTGRLFNSILLAAVLLPTAGVAEQPDFTAPTYGRSAEDMAKEKFLLESEITEIRKIGEGITDPYIVHLRMGGRQERAIFKTVNIDSRDPHYTSTFEFHFTDKYVYEVAAYRLDRLLGINLTPPAVIREINGEEGSVQTWIESAIKMQDAMDRNLPAGDVELFLKRKVMMNVLDALIHNIDRNPSNILVRPEDDGLWLIDHSRSFRENSKLPFFIEDWSIPAPSGLRERIEALDRNVLDDMLGELLTPKQIKAILKRRDKVLKVLK